MIYYLGMGENDYGFQFNKGVITPIFRYYSDIVNTLRFPFLPIFWIPLAGLIFFYGLTQNTLIYFELRMLSGSAICYYLGYVLVTPTSDFRYIYWSIISTTIASLMIACNLYSLEYNNSNK